MVRTCLLLSQRLTYWCNYHLRREGLSILRAPPIRHNSHVIDAKKRFVPEVSFFRAFQLKCTKARLCPMAADKTEETHSRSLDRAAELFKHTLRGNWRYKQLFPEEDQFEVPVTSRSANGLVEDLKMVDGQKTFDKLERLGGPHIAEHLEKDYGRKAHQQGQAVCLVNALLGCETWADALKTGFLHVNGLFHYLLLTRLGLRERYKVLRDELTSSHGCDFALMLSSTLAVICDLEAKASSSEFGKVKELVAGAAAYPLIVQSAVNFRSDVQVDPDTGMHALSSY